MTSTLSRLYANAPSTPDGHYEVVVVSHRDNGFAFWKPRSTQEIFFVSISVANAAMLAWLHIVTSGWDRTRVDSELSSIVAIVRQCQEALCGGDAPPSTLVDGLNEIGR